MLEQSLSVNFRTEDSFVSKLISEETRGSDVETKGTCYYNTCGSPSVAQQPGGSLPTPSTNTNPSISYLDALQPQGSTDITPMSMSGFEIPEHLRGDWRARDRPNFTAEEEDYDQLPERSDDIELVRMLYLLLSHRQGRAAPRIVADIDTLSLPEILFTALGVSSSGAGRTFAIADINNDLVELILGRCVDPNVTTSYFRARGRSAWHLFVHKWVRATWSCEFEPDATRSLSLQRSKVDVVDLKAWSIARLLLLRGADIDSNCCLAGTLRCGRFYQEHDCRPFPMAQVLNACVPASEHSDLQLLLARSGSSSAHTTVEHV